MNSCSLLHLLNDTQTGLKGADDIITPLRLQDRPVRSLLGSPSRDIFQIPVRGLSRPLTRAGNPSTSQLQARPTTRPLAEPPRRVSSIFQQQTPVQQSLPPQPSLTKQPPGCTTTTTTETRAFQRFFYNLREVGDQYGEGETEWRVEGTLGKDGT